ATSRRAWRWRLATPKCWAAASLRRERSARRRASPSAATGSECTAGQRAGRSSTTSTCTSSPAPGAAVASHVIDYQLFGDQFSTPEMRAVFDEHTLLAGPFVDGAASRDRKST